MNLNALRNFSTKSGADIEQLVAVRSDLKLLASNFDDIKLDIPPWVVVKIDEVEAEIKAMTRAEKLAALQKAKAKRSSLMTRDELREKLDADIKAMEDDLK